MLSMKLLFYVLFLSLWNSECGLSERDATTSLLKFDSIDNLLI